MHWDGCNGCFTAVVVSFKRTLKVWFFTIAFFFSGFKVRYPIYCYLKFFTTGTFSCTCGSSKGILAFLQLGAFEEEKK